MVKFLDYTRVHMLDTEKYDEVVADSIEKTQIEAFISFILKTNEIQLRKMFLNLVSWSEKKLEVTECGYLFPNYKKIILSKIICTLSESLGQLFTPFYSFIFENLIFSLRELKDRFAPASNGSDSEDSDSEVVLAKSQQNKKRKQFENEQEENTLLHFKFLKLVLGNMKALFDHDKEQFLDT